MNIGSVRHPGRYGQLYGVEFWDTSVALTIFLFFIYGMIQAGIHYGTAILVDRIWSKRAAEEFELKESLLENKEVNGFN